MMVGLDSDRVLQALEVLEGQRRDAERMLRLVADYSMPNVSEKIVRIVHSYRDYVMRTVWKNINLRRGVDGKDICGFWYVGANQNSTGYYWEKIIGKMQREFGGLTVIFLLTAGETRLWFHLPLSKNALSFRGAIRIGSFLED